jgi:hypothetical protein
MANKTYKFFLLPDGHWATWKRGDSQEGSGVLGKNSFIRIA